MGSLRNWVMSFLSGQMRSGGQLSPCQLLKQKAVSPHRVDIHKKRKLIYFGLWLLYFPILWASDVKSQLIGKD